MCHKCHMVSCVYLGSGTQLMPQGRNLVLQLSQLHILDFQRHLVYNANTRVRSPWQPTYDQLSLILIILFLAIGAVSWLTMARVVRGQVLSLKAQPFAKVNPNPIPSPSMMDEPMLFLDANASALPKTTQLTTISGIKIPSDSKSAGT